MGSWTTVNNLSNKVYVPSKTEDLNLSGFNTIAGIKESKIVTKDTSCECKWKFEDRNWSKLQSKVE